MENFDQVSRMSKPETEDSIYESSARMGKVYTQHIEKLTGNNSNIESQELSETGLDRFVAEGNKYFQIQSERFEESDRDAEFLLKQLFKDGELPPGFMDSSKYDLVEPSEGVFILKIDEELLRKIRPNTTALAFKSNKGVSFVLVPIFEDSDTTERIQEENIPHEVSHLFWKGVMDSDLLEVHEEGEFKPAYTMYQDELIARMCSGGVLSGYSHLALLNPEKQETIAVEQQDVREEILNTVGDTNELLLNLSKEMQVREVTGESLIGLVVHAKSFAELKSSLTEYQNQLLLQPITKPDEPQSTSWTSIQT